MSRLLFAIGIAVLLAGSAYPADDAEDKAVKFVENLKGKVIRDDKQPGKPVVTVRLFAAKVKDADLKELAAFKTLTTLDLSYTKVTDVGLKALAAFKNLTTLNIDETEVGDAGLKELAALKTLTTLDLIGTKKVSDAALKELRKALPKCNVVK